MTMIRLQAYKRRCRAILSSAAHHEQPAAPTWLASFVLQSIKEQREATQTAPATIDRSRRYALLDIEETA